MKCTTLIAISAAYLATGAVAATATTTSMGVEQPSSAPIIDQPVVQGCFSSKGDLVFNSSQTYNSRGKCGQDICQAAGYWVAATTEGKDCYCGNTYPSNDTLADDSKCNTPCTGYGEDACGGVGYYTVYNTGIELYEVEYANDTSSSASSSTSSSATSSATSSSSATTTQSSTTTIASNGQTVYVTQSSSATSTAETTKKSSTSKAGIAAGVVVGVVVAAALAGGAFFFVRRRRNREIEDEHRRNAAVNSFFGKPPSSSGGFSASDTRLDPVMAQRRMSDGSIADNQDYSRKILRVTNA